jgi:hypothetical protein
MKFRVEKKKKAEGKKLKTEENEDSEAMAGICERMRQSRFTNSEEELCMMKIFNCHESFSALQSKNARIKFIA